MKKEMKIFEITIFQRKKNKPLKTLKIEASKEEHIPYIVAMN
jgi:hypothetical protein